MNEQNLILEQVEVAKIYILNPRERSAVIAKQIQKNIEDVGLKRPITVCKKPAPKNGYEYDLVCGQGRLETYIANNQKFIPAIIIEAPEEDVLIMSLVENIARKNYLTSELFSSVKRMKERGFSNKEVAGRIGLSEDYVSQISLLLERGEDRLLAAVENKKMALNMAIEIAQTQDSEMQSLLQDAYEKGLIKGNKIRYIKKLLAIRQRNGKSIRVRNKRPTAEDLTNIYEQEISRKRLLIAKAERVENMLIFLTQGLKQMLKDENFINLLRAENIGDPPELLAKGNSIYG